MDENIGKKLVSLLALVLCLGLLSVFVPVAIKEHRRAELEKQWQAEAAESHTYTEGFCAGMRATLNNVKLANTNVDLAPILDELNRQYTVYQSNELARVKQQ